MSSTTQETNNDKSVSERIVDLMLMEPGITVRQIADCLNISFDGVCYHIKKLKPSGKIQREGSTKAGKWIVKK